MLSLVCFNTDFNTHGVCCSQNNLSCKWFDCVYLCSVTQCVVGIFCFFYVLFELFHYDVWVDHKDSWSVLTFSVHVFKIECDPLWMRKREIQNCLGLSIKCFWRYSIRMLVLAGQNLLLHFYTRSVSLDPHQLLLQCGSRICCFDLIQCGFCFTESL